VILRQVVLLLLEEGSVAFTILDSRARSLIAGSSKECLKRGCNKGISYQWLLEYRFKEIKEDLA